MSQLQSSSTLGACVKVKRDYCRGEEEVPMKKHYCYEARSVCIKKMGQVSKGSRQNDDFLFYTKPCNSGIEEENMNAMEEHPFIAACRIVCDDDKVPEVIPPKHRVCMTICPTPRFRELKTVQCT